MAISGFTAPSNITVWKRGVFTKIVNKKVETGGSNMIPGALVQIGSSAGEIALNDEGDVNPIGWISFEDTPAQYIDGHSITTAFATDDIIAIVSGPGTGVQAVLATSQTITEGDLLVAADNGQVQEASASTITIASGSVTVKSDKAQPDEAVAGSYGAEGIIVATAAEAVTTTTSAALLAVTSHI